MTISPLANLPLTQAVYPELKRIRSGRCLHPRSFEVDTWLSIESPSRDRFLKYFGIHELKTNKRRQDIQYRHLMSLMTSLSTKLSVEYYTPRNSIRFDRLEWLYCNSSTEEKSKYDMALECIFGKNMQECLSEEISVPIDGLAGLKLTVVDSDDGPELKAYCDLTSEWKPAELLPYRFQLVKNTIERSDDPEDDTPNYVDTLLAHSADLEKILPVAVNACLNNKDPRCTLSLEYYCSEILMAYKRKGQFGWVHPELDDDDSPAYWRPEYPFDPAKLLKDVMLLESEAGGSKTSEAVMAMDLGL